MMTIIIAISSGGMRPSRSASRGKEARMKKKKKKKKKKSSTVGFEWHVKHPHTHTQQPPGYNCALHRIYKASRALDASIGASRFLSRGAQAFGAAQRPKRGGRRERPDRATDRLSTASCCARLLRADQVGQWACGSPHPIYRCCCCCCFLGSTSVALHPTLSMHL